MLQETCRKLLEQYGDLLYRICLTELRCVPDAEDCVQETFFRCLRADPVFAGEAHARAWLIRTAINLCRDQLRYRTRHGTVSIDAAEEMAAPEESREALRILFEMPEENRIPLLLHCAEGYSTAEIAACTGLSREAVKKRIQRGRKWLGERLESEGVGKQ